MFHSGRDHHFRALCRRILLLNIVPRSEYMRGDQTSEHIRSIFRSHQFPVLMILRISPIGKSFSPLKPKLVYSVVTR